MYYDKLARQSKIIQKERKINIFLLSCGVFFLIPFLWATICDLRGLLIVWLPCILILVAIKWITANNRLLKQFSGIVENNAINKTYEIMLDRPKIGFLVYPEIHSHNSPWKKYYGITIIDRRKHRYYYFFDESVTIEYNKVRIQRIRGEFCRELRIQCYENTSIIRTIDNDPRFWGIKFGSVYK